MKTRKNTTQPLQNSRKLRAATAAGKRQTAKHPKAALAACILPAVFLGYSAPASASSYTWTKDSAATQDWTATGNWATSGVFVSATDATLQIFADTTTALTAGNNQIITSVPNFTLNTLTLNGKGAAGGSATNVTLGTAANSWTFDGVTPTINLNGIAGTQALNYTVAPSLILNQNLTVQGAGTAGFTFSGNISGAGGLTKSGTSIMTLSGSNSFSGSTAVNAGTVIISGTNALAGTSSVAVANSAKLQLQPGAVVTGKSVSIVGSGNGTNLAGALRETGDGYALWAGGVVVTGACRIGAERVSTSGTLEISGVISGAAGNTVTYRNVGGAVYLTGPNTYLGQTQIFGGTPIDFVAVNSIKDVGVASSLGAPTTTALGTIQLGNGANTAWLKYIGTGDTTNRVIDLFATTATTTLDQSGTGLLKFTSNFTATGAGSKTFVLTGATAGTGELAGAVVDNGGSNITSLTKNGTGLWILSGTNTYTGATTVSAGALEISSTAALPGATVNGRYSVANGATLAVQNTVGDADVSAMLSSTNFAAGAAIGYDTTAGNRTLSGARADTAQGALGLTKLGVNTLTLTGSNTYTGVTTIGGGTLQVGDGVADGSIVTSSIVNNGALVYNVVGNRAAGSAISGSGTLTKSGAGALNLSGTSTYTGNTTLSAGTLQLGASGVGTAAAITSSPVGKGTLVLNGGAVSSDSATARTVLNPVTFAADMPLGDAINSGKLTFSGTADLGGTTRTLTAASTVEFAGPVIDGGITKNGAGTAILSGTNTFTGAVTVNAGTLQAAMVAALSSGSAVALNNAGSTLAVNFGGASDYTQTQIGTLLGKTTFGTGTVLGIDTTNGSGTYSNALSMAAGLTKLGANTLTLTGSNTYTGVTTISSGTLQLGDGTSFGTIGSSSGVVDNGNLTINATNAQTFALPISGTGSLTIARTNGTPAITLSGSNTYSGPTNVASGELVIGNSNALAGTSAVTVSGTGSNFGGRLSLVGGVTVTGKTVTISGAGNSGDSILLGALRTGDANTNTWAGGVVLAGDARVGGAIGSGGTLVISGVISSASTASLTFRANTANVTFSGTANTYPGQTLLNSLTADTLSVYSIKSVNGGASSLGAPTTVANGTIQITGGILRYLGSGDTTDRVIDLVNTTQGAAIDQSGTGLLKFTSNVTVSATGNRTLTLQGSSAGSGEIAGAIGDNAIAGQTSLAKSGSGTWTLSGANTYTGTTTISAGVLEISSTAALPGATVNGRYSVANGATLAVQNTVADADVSTMLSSTNFAAGAAIGYDTTAGNRTLSSARADTAQGALGLTKLGVNTLTLTGSNTYTGVTTIGAGTLQVGDGITDGAIVSSTSIVDNSALAFNLLGAQTYSAVISGTGTVTKNGSGTLTLSASSTFSGGTTLSAGTLRLGNVSALGTGALTVNAGTLDLNGNSLNIQALSGAGGVLTNSGSTTGTLTITIASGTSSLAGNVAIADGAAAVALTKGGNGMLLLTGNNLTYTGTTTVNAGVLQLGDGTSGHDALLSTAALADNSQVRFNYYGNQTVSYPISNNGTVWQQGPGTLTLTGSNTPGLFSIISGTLQIGDGTAGHDGSLTCANGIINSSALVYNVCGSGTASSVISGGGTVTKNGAGTLTLSGSNSYGGATIVNAGTLSVSSGWATNGGFFVAAGAALALGNGFSDSSVATVLGGSNFSAGATLGFDTTAGNRTYANPVANTAQGVLNLVKLGTNTLTMTGSSTYTGATTIGSGTLQIGDGTTEGSINASSGVVNNGNLTLTMTTSRSFVPTISGTGSITVTRVNGIPSVTLSASNSYTGPTNVAGGELVVTNSNALAGTSAVNVTSGDLLLKNGVTITGKTITIAGDGLHGDSYQMGALRNGDSNTSTWAGNVILSANARIGGYVGGGVVVSGTVSAASNYQLLLRAAGCNVTLSGTNNTYPGPTAINAGAADVMSFYSVKNVGQGASSLGAPANVADGTIQLFGGVLRYLGTGDTTDRVIDLASTSVGVALDQSGTGLLKFTSLLGTGTNSFKSTGAGSKTLTLQGSTGGTGEIAATIVDNGGSNITSLTKNGTGLWILSGTNTYTGATTVSAGTLEISSTAALPGATVNGRYSVANGATLAVQNTVGDADVSAMLSSTNFAAGAAIGYDTTAGNRTLSSTCADTAQGALGLTKLGVNTLTLTGSNTYTGVTTIGGGTLQVGDGVTDGSIASSSIVNNSALVYNVVGNRAAGSAISGSGTLTKSGAGALNLSGASTYTGNTTLSAGTLQLGASGVGTASAITSSPVGRATLVLNGGAVSSDSATARTVLNPVTFAADMPLGDAINSGKLTFSGTADLGGTTRTLTVASTVEFAGPVTDGGITKNGAGTAILSATNTFTGAVTVNAGILQAAMVAALSSASAVALNNAGSTLAVNFGGASDYNQTQVGTLLAKTTFGAGTALGIDTTNGSGAYSNALLMAAGLTKLGANTLTLTGSNTYTGVTTISSGTLQVGDGVTDGSIASSSGIVDNATLAYNLIGSGTYAHTISGSGALVKAGAGSLALTASNAYSGSTVVNAGALTLSNTASLGYTSDVTVANGGRVELTNGTTIAGKTITISGNGGDVWVVGALRGTSGTSRWAGPVIVAADATRIGAFNNATLEVSGPISAAGNADFSIRYRTAGGNVILSGTSTYSGNSLIYGSSGDIVSVTSIKNVGTPSSLGSSGTIQLGATTNPGYLKYIGTGDTTDRVVDLAATTGSVTLDQSGTGLLKFTSNFTASGTGNKTLTLAGATASAGEIAGAIVDNPTAGQTSLVKSGSGTWILSGVNTYTGSTTINAGVLQIGNANALGTGGLTVNGGSLDLNGNSVNVGALSGTGGSVTNSGSGTSTLATAIASGTATYAGGIANGTGAVALTKSGSGTLILSGSLAMAGLNANGGVTQLTQSDSIGAVSVASGATLSMAANSGGTRDVLNVSSLSISGFTSGLATGDSVSYACVDSASQGEKYAVLTETGNAVALATPSSDALPASPEAVPEPGMLGMLLAGASALLGFRRKAKRSIR